MQDLLENVADPKEFGKRGEPLFFGNLLLLALIFFPPSFIKVGSRKDALTFLLSDLVMPRGVS